MISEGHLAVVYIESLLGFGVIFFAVGFLWCGIFVCLLLGFLFGFFLRFASMLLLTECPVNEHFIERNVKFPCVL